MNKIYSMIGLACKAGKIVSGEDAVKNAIKSKKVKLLIIATDCSEGTKKKFLDSVKYYNLEHIIFGDKTSLGRYVGKSERAVIAICDENFSSVIKKYSNDN